VTYKYQYISLKLKKAYGTDVISNECLKQLTRRPVVHIKHLHKHCFLLSYFPSSWKEVKGIDLRKLREDPNFPHNLRPISLLSTTDKLSEKVIYKIVQKHLEENDLLNSSHFDFSARQTTTLQCMRLTNHVTLNSSNNMSTAAVFLGIEKAFDTTWHPGLLSKLHFRKI
jgi:hypothetical protein